MLNGTAGEHAGQGKHLGVIVEKNMETINVKCGGRASKEGQMRGKPDGY